MTDGNLLQTQSAENVEQKGMVVIVDNSPTNTVASPEKNALTTTNGTNAQSTPVSIPWYQILHVIGYVILGGCDTIIYKYQNTTPINGKKFAHPFIQTFVMEASMSLPLIWVIYKKLTKTYNNEITIDHNKKMMVGWRDYIWIIIPSLCDMIGSTLQFFSLLFIDSSIYQMMRGGSIIFTAIFSKYLFKRIFLKYKYLGLFLTIIGLILVGLSQFIFAGSASSSDVTMQYTSIGLLVICMALNGGHYTSEEFIYSKYNIHPCELLGTEAFYGAIIYLVILLPIFCNVQCNFPNGVGCVKVGNEYYFDNVDQYISAIQSNGWLLAFVIFGIFSKCIYNLNGVFTTRYFSSLTRSVAGALRTLVTWVIGLIVTAAPHTRAWESLNYKIILFMAAGYIFLFGGNLIYNGVFRIPYFDRECDLAKKKKSIELTDIQIGEKAMLKKCESKTSSEYPLALKTAAELKSSSEQ